MATKIEAGRQMVYTTAWRFAGGEYPVREISMAKLYTARMACEVIDECLQIHGGAGYMKEYGSSAPGATCALIASAPARTRSCST